MVRKSLSLACVALISCSSAAFSASVNTISNVIFIVDESGSMGGEQAFLEDVVINNLDSELALAGVTTRKYGVVGYGGSISNQDPRAIGGFNLANAATTKANLGDLTTSGGTEDGYEAIDFALSNFSFDNGAAINFILVTDEDRDVAGGPDKADIFDALTQASVLLNTVINNPFGSDDGAALGVDSTGEAYLTDGAGGFLNSTNGTVGNGSGSTETDYAQLALDTGGAAWNLNVLRNGGLDAQSFSEAFIDVKVTEITTQPPSPGPGTAPIPLPAAAWLMLAGLGGLGAVKRMRKAA